MKDSYRIAVCALGFLWGLGLAQAQTMPQDNWRYDGLNFVGPDAGINKRCIAIGLGGVYVGQGDPATTIVQFQENGVFVRKFGAFGEILGMACDSAGNVYVLDRSDSKVKVFSKDGDALREWGGPGSADGQFSLPPGVSFVAVDSTDQVYVCDPGNSRIQVFNDQGVFLRKIGSLGTLPGQFAAGQPLAIAIGKNGWVYAVSATTTPPRLQIFDAQGVFVKSRNDVASDWCTVAVTADGVFAFEDYNWYCVHFLDLSLADLGSRTPQWTTQRGIAFNARGDLYQICNTAVYVLEREYSGVQNSRLPPAIPQPIVMAVAQRAGTSKLDVDYKVTDADSPTVHVAALAFVDGGNALGAAVPMSTFVEGTAVNIGPNQPANTTRRITWDMAADWSTDFAQIQVEVLAKDSRNLLGVHWIKVPADGGLPAIEISRTPVSDAELLSLWYWFIATHNTGITYAAGIVRGAATGVYAGMDLASGTGTTAAGRRFAYDQMGIRAIRPDEIARAQAGSYGFTSVDGNSVVREAPAVPENAIIGWGYDGYGQASGLGPNAFGSFTTIAGGSQHSLALSSDGSVFAWGYNNYGQCNVPAGLASVTAIAAGENHSLALKSDKTVVAWGYNNYGQCNVPAGLTNVTAIAAGLYHSLALKSDKTVVAWGSSDQGLLNVPVGLTNVTAIAVGQYHSLALKSDGTVVAWEYNSQGQCGVPAGLTNVTAIAAGGLHSLALKSDKTVVVWGYNAQGQLNVPVGLANVTAIAAGMYHNLALKSDKTVVAWEYNAHGQCSVPAGLTNVTAIAAGGYQSLALKQLH